MRWVLKHIYKNHLSRCAQPEPRCAHRPITRPTDSLGGRQPLLKTGAGRCAHRDSGCAHRARERCFLIAILTGASSGDTSDSCSDVHGDVDSCGDASGGDGNPLMKYVACAYHNCNRPSRELDVPKAVCCALCLVPTDPTLDSLHYV